MKVRLCGVRGSTPAPGVEFAGVGGNTSCVAVTADDRAAPTLILDAGTGIRSITGLVAPEPFRGTILLSHLHWDHVQGLPFFAAADRPDASVRLLLPRDEPTTIGDTAAGVLRRAMSPPHFPIGPEGLLGDWRFAFVDDGEFEIEGFTVTACQVDHKGGTTLGFRIADRHSTFAYLPDHQPPAGGQARATAIELAREVDVLIHDAQFLPAELRLAEAYGHSTVDQAIDLAVEARARTLVLFHHAPGRTDAELEAIVRDVDAGGVVVHLGREGDELTPGLMPAGRSTTAV